MRAIHGNVFVGKFPKHNLDTIRDIWHENILKPSRVEDRGDGISYQLPIGTARLYSNGTMTLNTNNRIEDVLRHFNYELGKSNVQHFVNTLRRKGIGFHSDCWWYTTPFSLVNIHTFERIHMSLSFRRGIPYDDHHYAVRSDVWSIEDGVRQCLAQGKSSIEVRVKSNFGNPFVNPYTTPQPERRKNHSLAEVEQIIRDKFRIQITPKELADILDRDESTAFRYLERLSEDGRTVKKMFPRIAIYSIVCCFCKKCNPGN